MRLKTVFFMTAFLLLALCLPASAAEYASKAEMEQMRKDMQELKNLVGDLKSIIKQQNETIKELREHSKEDEHEEEGHIASAKDDHDEEHSDSEMLSFDGLLDRITPNISVTGDFVANVSDDHHTRSTEDRFDLRGVDIDFMGEIDGIGKAYANIAYHDDDVELEEAYLIVEELLPFHTDLKFGKFRADFGLLNTIHPHALPQVDYPAVYREYLGEEGYIDEGVGIAGSFPSLWGSPIKYSLQALNGNRHDHDGDDDGHGHDDEDRRLKDYDDIVYIARLRNDIDLSDHMEIKWGLSGLSGRFENDEESPRFYYQGGDLTLIWRPFRDEHKRIRWQSEFISAQIEEDHSWERSYGMYSFIDYQFAPRWILGARYDYAETPLQSRDHITEYSAYLTHQYTDNNRLRVQFKNSQRNHDKDSNEILLQWVFTLGRHEHLDEDDDHDH